MCKSLKLASPSALLPGNEDGTERNTECMRTFVSVSPSVGVVFCGFKEDRRKD